MSQNSELFKKVVEHVFNNWTALQLAVEHQMGGPTSRQTAVEAMNWVTDYCLSHTIQADDLCEALEDILDEEFELICEDDSPKQVAHVLVKFLQFLNDGNLQQFETDFNCLPTCKIWLSQPQPQPENTQQSVTTESTESASQSQEMDVDSEWTVVHNKRKK